MTDQGFTTVPFKPLTDQGFTAVPFKPLTDQGFTTVPFKPWTDQGFTTIPFKPWTDQGLKILLISPCHRSHDNLLPSNQLLTYPKIYLDMCNQLYSVSLINFGPRTQNNQPWLGGSKLHSKL